MQKLIFRNILKAFILLFIAIGCKTESKQNIVHIENLEVITNEHTQKFDKAWFNSEKQVVIYASHLGEFSMFNQNWKPFIIENPEIKFIFYYSGKNKNRLQEWMNSQKFPSPILFDPDKLFYESNITSKVSSICFLVNDGEIISLSNPTFPEFQERLDEL